MTSFPRSDHVPKDIRLPPIHTQTLGVTSIGDTVDGSLDKASMSKKLLQSIYSNDGGIAFKKKMIRNEFSGSIDTRIKVETLKNTIGIRPVNKRRKRNNARLEDSLRQSNDNVPIAESDTWETIRANQPFRTANQENSVSTNSNTIKNIVSKQNKISEGNGGPSITNSIMELDLDLQAIKLKKQLHQVFPSSQNTYLYSIQHIDEYPIPESKIPRDYYATQDLEKQGKTIASSQHEQQEILDQLLLASYSDYKPNKVTTTESISETKKMNQINDYIDSSSYATKHLIFPTANPTKRLEVILLAKAIDDMLQVIQKQRMNENLAHESKHKRLMLFLHATHEIHLIALNEVTRQVYTTCSERGVILLKLHQFFEKYFEIAVEIIQQERKKSSDLRDLIKEYESLTNDLAVEKQQQANEMEQLLRDQSNLFKDREVLRKQILTGATVHPKSELIVNLLKNSKTRNKLLRSIQNELSTDLTEEEHDILSELSKEEDADTEIDEEDEYFRNFEVKRKKENDKTHDLDETSVTSQEEKLELEHDNDDNDTSEHLNKFKVDSAEILKYIIQIIQQLNPDSFDKIEKSAIEKLATTSQHQDISLEDLSQALKSLHSVLNVEKAKTNKEVYISVEMKEAPPQDVEKGKFIQLILNSQEFKSVEEAGNVSELYQTIIELQRENRQERETRIQSEKLVNELQEELKWYMEHYVQSDLAQQKLRKMVGQNQPHTEIINEEELFMEELQKETDPAARVKLLKNAIDKENQRLETLQRLLIQEESKQMGTRIVLGPYFDPHEQVDLISNASQREKDLKPMDQYMVNESLE